MTAVWTPHHTFAEPAYGRAGSQTLAALVVGAAVAFNFFLCFVNTKAFAVSSNLVIVAEGALLAMALGLAWTRSSSSSSSLFLVLLALAWYSLLVMIFRSDSDPKFIRDLLIPIVFFFLGRHLGSLRSADLLVTSLILVSLGIALIEWFALETYLTYFDVLKYYIARGTITGVETDPAAGLYISGSRFEERTLLPFLGEHRASGMFLEPVSVGNFGAIAFAWVLLFDRQRLWTFAWKSVSIATLLVLADARFGFYLCVCTIVIYLLAPLIRPWMILFAPFLAIVAIVASSAVTTESSWENTIGGRFVLAGEVLTSLDSWQVLGLRTTDLVLDDAGYAYALVKFGLLGMAAIWALFSFTRDGDSNAWRFKSFAAFYIVLLLSISQSLFTIKTAALLWFLYGTLNSPGRDTGQADDPEPHGLRRQVFSQ